MGAGADVDVIMYFIEVRGKVVGVQSWNLVRCNENKQKSKLYNVNDEVYDKIRQEVMEVNTKQ